ncbi:MAG: folate-binding protein [Cyanobacteria bacterium M_surface_7_m2_040]|nr:folate-binding protein [Cyanobacteria bacterium M_surface_7_m2_040]
MEAPTASCWEWRPDQPSRSERAAALVRLEGPDALRVLHGQSSQAIDPAPAGAALATCLISPTARLRGLAQVLVDASGAWLLIEAGDAEAVRTSLDRVLFPADRVELGPVQPALLITPVPGRRETAPTGELEPTSAGSWQVLDAGAAIWQLGAQLLIAKAGTATPAHPLAARPQLSALEQERWRIQQGWPSTPSELNDDTNPFELGLTDRVSLSKGCYVGQETLAKLATYDGVKQQLRRWWLPPGATTAPAAGQPLRRHDGERAGMITTALAWPEPDGSTLWLGLALVRRNALEQDWLLAGDSGADTESNMEANTTSAPRLALSKPDGFVDPPGGGAQR